MKGTGKMKDDDELDAGGERDAVPPAVDGEAGDRGEGSNSDPVPDLPSSLKLRRTSRPSFFAEATKDKPTFLLRRSYEGQADLRPPTSVPKRFYWFASFLLLSYGWVLVSLAIYALDKKLHSHILLIPFVSAYLIYCDRRLLPAKCSSSPGWATLFAIPGLASLAAALVIGIGNNGLSHNDFLALSVFSFLCVLAAGGFWFLGKRWMAAVAFPVAFLIFMIPLPDAVVIGFETFLMAASADAADLLFSISGTPYVRDGQVIQLSAITLEVAQECSGIRSSYVLFITSLLASYMILRSPWRRAILVGVVIPLGILRNGFRVLVIGLLCVHYGPHMVDSIIHKKGGPFFFALSLIPLFLLLWILRSGEKSGAEIRGQKSEVRDQGAED